eukprot:2313641-Prymnesium_polylepis.1
MGGGGSERPISCVMTHEIVHRTLVALPQRAQGNTVCIFRAQSHTQAKGQDAARTCPVYRPICGPHPGRWDRS